MRIPKRDARCNFADRQADSADDALDRWDNVKRSLNGYRTHAQAMDNVSRTLPALWRAEKLLGKAEKAGLRRENALAAVEALEARTAELRQAVEAEQDAGPALGETLFAATDAARLLALDPEDALNEALERFIRRFDKIERDAVARGETELSAEALAACWKNKER